MKNKTAILIAIVLGWITLIAVSCQAAKFTVDLAWDVHEDTNATGYRVYVSTNSFYGTNHGTPAWTNVTITGRTNNQATVKGLEPGVRYHFVATAFDDLGLESDFSNEIFWDAPTPPKPPTSLFKFRVTVETSCVDPLGPWTLEREMESLELATDDQKFFRVRLTATTEKNEKPPP